MRCKGYGTITQLEGEQSIFGQWSWSGGLLATVGFWRSQWASPYPSNPPTAVPEALRWSSQLRRPRPSPALPAFCALGFRMLRLCWLGDQTSHYLLLWGRWKIPHLFPLDDNNGIDSRLAKTASPQHVQNTRAERDGLCLPNMIAHRARDGARQCAYGGMDGVRSLQDRIHASPWARLSAGLVVSLVRRRRNGLRLRRRDISAHRAVCACRPGLVMSE